MPLIISIAVIPRLHMSALELYLVKRKTNENTRTEMVENGGQQRAECDRFVRRLARSTTYTHTQSYDHETIPEEPNDLGAERLEVCAARGLTHCHATENNRRNATG